jgi:endo-1,3(4)-beta-glucanase
VGNGAGVDAGGTVTLKSGSTITMFATPDGQDSASLAKLAADPVVSSSVDHSVDGDTVNTTLNYVTKNGGDTAIAALAGQTVDGGTKSGGSYASIYGTMDVYSGSSLTTTAPLAEPSDQLDVFAGVDMGTLRRHQLHLVTAAWPYTGPQLAAAHHRPRPFTG